jgi:hypothetical protein
MLSPSHRSFCLTPDILLRIRGHGLPTLRQRFRDPLCQETIGGDGRRETLAVEEHCRGAGYLKSPRASDVTLNDAILRAIHDAGIESLDVSAGASCKQPGREAPNRAVV